MLSTLFPEDSFHFRHSTNIYKAFYKFPVAAVTNTHHRLWFKVIQICPLTVLEVRSVELRSCRAVFLPEASEESLFP